MNKDNEIKLTTDVLAQLAVVIMGVLVTMILSTASCYITDLKDYTKSEYDKLQKRTFRLESRLMGTSPTNNTEVENRGNHTEETDEKNDNASP